MSSHSPDGLAGYDCAAIFRGMIDDSFGNNYAWGSANAILMSIIVIGHPKHANAVIA